MSSIVPYLDPSRDEKLRRQRRLSSIASVVISFLIIALVLLVLALMFLPEMVRTAPGAVVYAGPKTPEESVKQRPVTSTRNTPSAPSAAMARVVTANVSSDLSVPVPDFDVAEPSHDFGNGDDFGDGWGNGSGLGGGGGGGGGTTFFRQKVKGQRIAYVIDYSGSMGGQREKLMRAELSRSIAQLGAGMQFQIVCFGGPAWVAGSTVTMNANKTEALVELGEGRFKWRAVPGTNRWEPGAKKQRPEWISVAPGPIDDATRLVNTTPLVWGTDWESPLEMAIAMDPPPEVIFFMTDGAVGGDMVKLAEKLGHRAKRRGAVVNTVAMMEPEAEAAMKELAQRSGGQFTIVREGGAVEVVPLEGSR
jgi:hypothetical protein